MNALSGLLMVFLGLIFKVQTTYFYPGLCLFLLGTVVFNKNKYVVFLLAAIALIVFPLLQPAYGWLYGIILLTDFAVFLIILYELFDMVIKKQALNLFLTLLFVYMSIDIVKIFDLAVHLGDGYIYYSIGEAAQFLFALSFMFINYNTKNFQLKIKALEEIDTK